MFCDFAVNSNTTATRGGSLNISKNPQCSEMEFSFDVSSSFPDSHGVWSEARAMPRTPRPTLMWLIMGISVEHIRARRAPRTSSHEPYNKQSPCSARLQEPRRQCRSAHAGKGEVRLTRVMELRREREKGNIS